MYWILGAYLLCLFYASTHKDRVANPGTLRAAWLCFQGVAISQAGFGFIQVMNTKSPKDVLSLEMWSNITSWGLLSISIYYLTDALVPKAES